MKIGLLAALGHYRADSLASGTCLMIGIDFVDVFGEAARSHEKCIGVAQSRRSRVAAGALTAREAG